MAVEKLLSIDTTPTDKSVVVNVSTGGQPEHAVYSARIENGTLTIINSVTSTKRFSAPFDDVLINGQAYTTEQDCIAALGDIGNFNTVAEGGGVGDLSNYLPKTAGEGQALTGLLYANAGIRLTGILDLKDNAKIAFDESVIPGLSDYVTDQVEVYENEVVNPRTGQVIPIYPQVDKGNTHLPLNLSHGNNELTGKYITYDVGANWNDPVTYPRLSKQVLATFTEGVLQLPANFFNPVADGSGGYTIEEITLTQLNIYAFMYGLGLYPVAIDQSVLTFRVTRLVINDAVAYFDYNFTKVSGDTIERFVVSVTGTGAAVNTLRCDRTVWQIGQLPIPFYLPYGSGTNTEVDILDSGITLQIAYKNPTTASIKLYAKNGSVQTSTIYRTSLVAGAPENTILSDELIDSTPVDIDADVYTNGTDAIVVRIWVPSNFYLVEVFGIKNGFAVGEIRKIHA